MKLRARSISLTTDASGDKTHTDDIDIIGLLEKVEYVLGTFAAGVDVTISVTNTPGGVDQTLLTLTDANANAAYYPRVVMHGNTGTALTGTAGGDTTKQLIYGNLKIVVAQGGNAKTGRVIVYYHDLEG